jgi:hypothetical protein
MRRFIPELRRGADKKSAPADVFFPLNAAVEPADALE